MDRYRYFIFNQKSMVLLGLFQIACATICIISGLIDGAFRRESALSKSRIPIWAGMVNAMIIASVFSCFTTLIVIVYASITLEYGEKYEGFNDLPSNHPAFAFVLDKLVEGANITILIVSIFSAFIVLIIAYVSCRSLPCCSCYDSVTGLEWLQSNEDQLQTAELVCISPGQADRIFNSPEKLPDLKMEADDEMTKPPPYIRLT
ncbi:uncharacterized protein LOC133364435 isoform X2 [Rhineura floridana]|uniref:uncharacterized protein LOC133364435 isoform X2 n=1 Tax=Rhineura floridana TaxID=261503 RepID=UPI002AC847AF|nr:uncharacterized protein LOC133364435 isoform X2 [Rhineura floridana]